MRTADLSEAATALALAAAASLAAARACAATRVAAAERGRPGSCFRNGVAASLAAAPSNGASQLASPSGPIPKACAMLNRRSPPPPAVAGRTWLGRRPAARAVVSVAAEGGLWAAGARVAHMTAPAEEGGCRVASVAAVAADKAAFAADKAKARVAAPGAEDGTKAAANESVTETVRRRGMGCA